MSKIMAIYPPSKHMFQRGEDRCQIDVNASSANSVRPCNDLGYVVSLLALDGHNVFLKDYQIENLKLEDLINDVKIQKPDIVFISTVNASIYSDLEIVEEIKKINSEITVILKGALFFNIEKNILNRLNLANVDYLIGGEVEFIIRDLIYAHLNDKSLLKNIEGISYKISDDWITNNLINFNDNLDEIPFPDRSKMNNALYINPLTNKSMATITTAKGCPFSCIYCLSPVISGKKVRERSSLNIFKEIEECVNKYNITNFFFKSDTFTSNKQKVLELCSLICEKNLNEKINWVANSRVDTIDEELIINMKKAGCSLIAFGFESGCKKSLENMKKNTTLNQNFDAVRLCQKHGMEILGYFLIGFPFEDKQDLLETKKHIFELNPDYIEISVVVPFPKTPIYENIKNNSNYEVVGFDSYNNIYQEYSMLNYNELKDFRKKTILQFYTRPGYIFKRFKRINSLALFGNYIKYGLRMLKNSLF